MWKLEKLGGVADGGWMSAQKEICALFWVFVLASTLVVMFGCLCLIFFE
jgi:hypothetical protein